MVKILGRVGALLGVLFLLSVLDTIALNYLDPDDLYRTLPGEEQFVSGKLPTPIPSRESLAFTADSPRIQIEFAAAQGRIWRGRLTVESALQPGEYGFRVHLKWEPAGEQVPLYTVVVFHDKAEYRASLPSVFFKYFNIAPWWITATVLPLVLLCLGLSHRISTRQEQVLNREGLASVFKVNRSKEGCEINFGLGIGDDIREGESLWLLNRRWQPVGEVKVKTVRNQYATAEVDPGLQVKPDYVVCKKKPG